MFSANCVFFLSLCSFYFFSSVYLYRCFFYVNCHLASDLFCFRFALHVNCAFCHSMIFRHDTKTLDWFGCECAICTKLRWIESKIIIKLCLCLSIYCQLLLAILLVSNLHLVNNKFNIFRAHWNRPSNIRYEIGHWLYKITHYTCSTRVIYIYIAVSQSKAR